MPRGHRAEVAFATSRGNRSARDIRHSDRLGTALRHGLVRSGQGRQEARPGRRRPLGHRRPDGREQGPQAPRREPGDQPRRAGQGDPAMAEQGRARRPDAAIPRPSRRSIVGSSRCRASPRPTPTCWPTHGARSRPRWSRPCRLAPAELETLKTVDRRLCRPGGDRRDARRSGATGWGGGACRLAHARRLAPHQAAAARAGPEGRDPLAVQASAGRARDR